MLAEKAVNGQNYSYVRADRFHDWWDTGQYHNADYANMRIFTVGNNAAFFGDDTYTFRGDSEERPDAWVQGTVAQGYGRTSNNADVLVLIRLGQRADGAVASLEDL